MRLSFTLIFTLIFTGLMAQADLTIKPSAMEVSGLPSDKIQADYKVTNEGNEAIDVLWRVVRVDVPDTWEFSICDYHTCYDFGIETCPEDKWNPFNVAYEQVYMVKADPNGDAYVGQIEIEYFSLDDPDVVYNSIPITYDATLSSTNDLEIDLISLFPNPTNDVFQISNDKDVKRVGIYNIVGKQVKSFEHEAGSVHDISDFEKGMYLVRLFDKQENNLKVIRLSKR